jgi:hypothetical protein
VVAASSHQNVARSEIAMQNAFFVQMKHAGANALTLFTSIESDNRTLE